MESILGRDRSFNGRVARPRSCRYLLVAALLLALCACGGSKPRAPVEDRYARPLAVADSSTYKVQRGDTLYSIAFRYGLDYRQVAAANGIPAPYTIFPGQRIYLREAPPTAGTTAANAGSSSRATAAASPTVAAPATGSAAAVAATGASTAAVTGSSSSSGTKSSEPAPSSGSQATQNKAATPVPSGPVAYTGKTVSSWRWPTQGRVSRRYSASVHKGVDIAGERGDAIVAVADGKVVYAGTGIVGFGELLIIKHNEVYLSAYGHNARLLVREDQLVRSGQKIAEKGSTGTDTVKLHFEIRKEGKPVDPLKLLPSR